MVDAHGGRIAVECAGNDKGAIFTVTLRTVSAPAVLAGGAITLPSAPLEERKWTNGHTPRLLLVDDHEDTCTGMKMLLERRGYEVVVAYTAQQAMDQARTNDFDLLISDIGLPDRSGYELMRDLQASKGLRGIALSGFGSEHDVAQAREAGFSDHLTKPINFDRLEDSIQQLLDLEPAGKR
jgi:CheY-like chemotaxis protein